ncbi:MAG: hypothetical protein ISR58_14005 [Anaerolineales bacterium]|nr:hypothetical protein [Chloroflexota bacterium]MBL6982288.1 hypothetical protein [Anaerolineales bacterium]
MKSSTLKRLVVIVVLFTLFAPTFQSQAASLSQDSSPEARALDLLENLTPEERVGQLFLVTFQGTNADTETQIHDLITNHYLGGVVLSAENDNFTEAGQTISDAWILTNQLQNIRFSSSQEDHIIPLSGETFQPAYIPLFVGLSQEGDGPPNDEIFSGLTSMPSQLSIGATWNPDLARQVGNITGHELASIGINLLFGPSLDVSETPNPGGEGDLDVRVYGGDPYWVGEMAKAYIEGVHEGASNHIAVVGTHFPGLGSADRLPDYEVATVRKSLEQLQQIELAPFFTVTGNTTEESSRLDALLVSHIRYQGLQGNIRSTTRPISFDQPALSLLMALSPFATWRDGGGVIISDDLGSRAVRRFHDPTEETFNARRLALDAFLAGNDMLYLNNFVGGGDADSYTTIIRTLEFFAQRYRDDPVFAQRVDESVLRILTLKYRMYGIFTLNLVLPTGNLAELDTVESRQITSEVAQRGATLISPPLSEFDNVLPNAPGFNDRIVFVTDTFPVQQCSECPIEEALAINAMEQSVINLYGPGAEGLISQANLHSYSFEQLTLMLDGEDETRLVERNLSRAHWIIFTSLDVDTDRAESLALQRFLAERPDLTAGKNIVVFAANAPYYLDATDISKLTVFFGLYGKTAPFMEVAARLLFREITAPEGALPVSVPGIGYELISATSPNPENTIPFILDLPESGDATPSSEISSEFEYRIGDSIPLKMGVILDHNNNPVPDNTPIQIIASIDGQEFPAIDLMSADGIASISYKFEQSGTVRLRALSGAASSDELVFDIPAEDTPEPIPTELPTQTPIPTLTPTIPAPTPTPMPEPEIEPQSTGLRDWGIALLIIAAVAWGAARVGALMGHVRRGVRWGLVSAISGLLIYTYGALSFPGSEWAMQTTQHWGLLLGTFIGSLLGWGLSAIFTDQGR